LAERGRSQQTAGVLEEDRKQTIQTGQARQKTRPARDRDGGEGNGKRRRHDPARIAERACEEGGDAAQIERCGRSRGHQLFPSERKNRWKRSSCVSSG